MPEALGITRQYQLYGYFAVPPLLTSRFDDLGVIEGDAVSVSCTASGLPEPTYIFRKVSLLSLATILIAELLLHVYRSMHKYTVSQKR